MGYNIDYLLRYVSMDTYNKIINSNNDYVLGLLSDNYIDVNLNIKYLIKYGVSNIDKIVYNNINDFIGKLKRFPPNSKLISITIIVIISEIIIHLLFLLIKSPKFML